MSASVAGTAGVAAGGRRALVVFSGQTDLWWLRLLKPGFRHCWVAVETGGCWVIVNPLSHVTDIAVVRGAAGESLAEGCRRAGMTVVAARTGRPRPRPAPWRAFSCVEAVRRILGLDAGRIFTPWQLFRHLQRNFPDDENKYLDKRD